jgi:hypothetical protein
MRTKRFTLLLAALALIQSGCSTGFRATGPKGGGVTAGVGVGQQPQQDGYIPPPPPPPPPPEAFR